MRKDIKITVKKRQKTEELQWSEKEKVELEKRILNLRKDQLGALLNLVGLNFSLSDIEEIVEDIKKNEQSSGHLSILVSEANSKNDLLWWICYFEKYSKNI